jgi:hypothetical protein
MLLQIGWLHDPAKISRQWLHEPANSQTSEEGHGVCIVSLAVATDSWQSLLNPADAQAILVEMC